MAEKSGGFCTIVTEAEMSEDKMSGLIINSLDMAAQIGIQAAQVDFKGAKLELENVKNPQFLREGQIYRKLAIFKGKDLSKLQYKFSFKHPRSNYEEETSEMGCSTSKIVKNEQLFQLVVSACCKEFSATAAQNKKLGVTYQVLNS